MRLRYSLSIHRPPIHQRSGEFFEHEKAMSDMPSSLSIDGLIDGPQEVGIVGVKFILLLSVIFCVKVPFTQCREFVD